MIKEMIGYKTDINYFEKFKHEYTEMKINNESQHEMKSGQMKALEERFVYQAKKIESISQ